MAVSGRKQTDTLGSMAAGSAEDFDNKCEPCLSIGQHIEAHGYCVTCQEYLCKTCHDCHKRTRALRNHQIFGRDEFHRIQNTKKSNNECIEQCTLHSKEIIKFYCPKHSSLCCNDCITIGHRSCKIDYIPDKCADIADGKCYQDMMMKLSDNLKEAEEVSKRAESSTSEIDNVNKEITKKIVEFRAEINNCLDQMQQDILKNVDEKMSNNKEIVQKVIDACGNIISNVKKLQSSLRASKSNNQNGQLYIEIKRAESTLKSEELAEENEQLNNMNIQYSFRRNADLEKLLTKEEVFGEIINHPQPVSSKKKKITDHLTIKNDINVKTKSDICDCYITGCAVLSSNKLVLADKNNDKLKVVSVDDKLILQEKVLDSEPWDIAVISKNQFAVTMPNAKIIDVMTIDNKLSRVRSIKIDRRCYGIDCHQDRLYVVCLKPSNVVVLTTQGNVLSNIPLNFLTDFSPYIAVRKDANLLYISDSNNNSIVGVSLQGDVTATYKHMVLGGPNRTCLLDDGSLLVCCTNGTIHKVKDDLKEGKIVNKDLSMPMSICYSTQNDEAYVGCYGNQLKVLSSK